MADRWVLIPAVASSLAMIAWSVFVGAGAAWAQDDPPVDQGCCFSFDHSPVNVVFCTTPDACRIGGKP